MLLGIVLAPVLPVVLGLVLIVVVDGAFLLGPNIFLGVPGIVLAAAETWSLLVGAVFLAVARLRGSVRRAHCLLLGAFLAFSLPSAALLASNTVDWAFGETRPIEDDFGVSFHGPSDGTLASLMGLILIPFGTLGGWVFWRVGVRPARPQVIDVATVFD